MQVSSVKGAIAASGGILAIALLLSATAAPPGVLTPEVAGQTVTLSVDPVQSKVHYSVESTLHTVHGTFNLKKGSALQFDPETGKASGEVAVYATSGESGNESRDARMHKEILETQKYPEAIFQAQQIDGKVALSGASDVQVHGTLLLHGGARSIVAVVHSEISGDHWQGTAKFPVPYIEWGIKDPSTWLLKVKPVVNVEVEMAGAVSGGK